MFLQEGGGGGVPKKNARLTLLLTLTLVLGLFDHRCFALECYYCQETRGYPSNYENCIDGGTPRKRNDGTESTMLCDPGQLCGELKNIYKGQVINKLQGCFTIHERECQDRALGQTGYCYKATPNQQEELGRQCDGGGRSASNNPLGVIGGGFSLKQGRQEQAGNTTSESRESLDDLVGKTDVEMCTCRGSKCNGPCQCDIKYTAGGNYGGGDGIGGGGSGSSTAFGTLTMVITGMAIILTGVSRWVG